LRDETKYRIKMNRNIYPPFFIITQEKYFGYIFLFYVFF
jgi:hypothetical protein